MGLSGKTRRALLSLARDAVKAYLLEGRSLTPGEDCPDICSEPRGAFVTLREADGSLRGCMGQIAAVERLDWNVSRLAVVAATQDPRFPPVRPRELPRLSIEISAMTPPERLSSVEEIEVGRHGLIVRRGGFQGLLLPQVATEYHWDRKTFLEQTCLKAGLPTDAWRQEGTDLFSFKAEVWGEDETPDASPV
ncbi:MAG: AmmeMemoRadiSam system protein A [Acidobacteriota bacterium]